MVRRHAGTGAFRGAHVFPGGRVDAEDVADEEWCDGVEQARRQLPDLPPAEAVAFHVCAARELFEEAGRPAGPRLIGVRSCRSPIQWTADGSGHTGTMSTRITVRCARFPNARALRLALDPLTIYRALGHAARRRPAVRHPLLRNAGASVADRGTRRDRDDRGRMDNGGRRPRRCRKRRHRCCRRQHGSLFGN